MNCGRECRKARMQSTGCTEAITLSPTLNWGVESRLGNRARDGTDIALFTLGHSARACLYLAVHLELLPADPANILIAIFHFGASQMILFRVWCRVKRQCTRRATGHALCGTSTNNDDDERLARHESTLTKQNNERGNNT